MESLELAMTKKLRLLQHSQLALLFLLLLWAAVTLSCTTSHAQKADGQPSSWLADVMKSGGSEAILKQYSPKLAQLQDIIAKNASTPESRFRTSEEIEKAIDALEDVRPALREFVGQLSPKLKEAQAKLEKLGPAPKEGKTESDQLAGERKTLSDEVAAYDGLIKRAEVLFVQAGQLISDHNSQRRKQFLSDLLRRSTGIVDRNFFSNLNNSIAIRSALATAMARERLTKFVEQWPALVVVVSLALIVFFLGRRLGRLLFRVEGLRHPESMVHPTRAERSALVLRRVLSVVGPAVASFLILLFVGHALALIRDEEFTYFARFIAYASVALFLTTSIHFSLKPPREIERLIAIDSRSATAFQVLAAAYILVWLGDQGLSLLDQFFQTPFLLVVLRISIVSILYALLLLGLIAVRIRRKGAHPSTRRTNGWPNSWFALVALVAALILGTSLLGYVSLARFIGSQLVATGGLILLVTLMHLTAEFVSSPKSESGDDEEPTMLGATMGVAVGIGLDALILLIGLPLLLLQWGFDWTEVRTWISSAIFGFQIGQLRISLLQIFVAILLFLAGLLITRLIRNMFVRRTEQMFASSTGARDSIAAVLGYTGTIVSLITALTYIGIDLANLALIAGALSVGIGFGLQSIVNNFVSGLILLAERPVKVGDWIVVGDKQGRVQKISVRSTQIRMFDRATLVLPNADLITNQVINWDLGDSVGRVSISVGVSYDSDPRQVIKILLDIGKSHRGVLVYDRSPRVMFEAFGDSSLNFVLHVHLRNIKDFLDVQTDLRVAIVEAFREAKIEIPYPQRDLHLRSSNVEWPSNAKGQQTN
jgi:potassium-dependent mechanosensitive channel